VTSRVTISDEAQSPTLGVATSGTVVELREGANGTLRRARLASLLIVSDLVVAAIAYGVALSVRHETALDGRYGRLGLSWSMLVLLAVTLGVFYLLGLYEDEVFILRPLHLWTLARAVFFAFLIGAGGIYLLRLPIVFQSRGVVVGTFVLFFVIAAVVRVGILSRLYAGRKPRGGVTLVIGAADRTARLRERLCELRVFGGVRVLDTGCGGPDSGVWFRALLSQALRSSPTGVAHVFVDAGDLKPSTVFDLVGIAYRAGVDVYVVSNLVRSLNCRRLLFDLFEAPVVRVRRPPKQPPGSRAERVFDVAVSFTVLALALPLMLLIALAIRVTSAGPALLAQERIGRDGRPFRFYKFRSMSVVADDQPHVQYVRQFIKGHGDARSNGDPSDPEEVYKLVEDDRVTRVGHYLRKLSLDELPQFWNVLKGDMSVVGPRPPLAYEVAEYETWHKERLAPRPGVTGLWQVQGRSRVTFDEMVFQDVTYALTRDLLVDSVICLRTVPAAIIGHGAA
jgi:lipopolysaccharide/colanic/teichoic acid biosynthesis glycosyltransferase